MSISPALGKLPELAAWGGNVNGNPTTTASHVNSFRISKVVEHLASHIQPGSRSDPVEFVNLCLSLSRGIDYALANGETPAQVNELPLLMKQIYQSKNDELLLAAVMVLMISVKNACKIGWFQMKESEELLTIADEIGKIYCTLGNINTGPSSCHSAIKVILDRFYPKMKLDQILVSIEVKPGYGASAVDFQITKNKAPKGEKIWLLVAQTDNTETSACLISPQQVNFLLNGKGIDSRTNVRMDSGPQMPTDVTSYLKFGTNLLQAVGQFNGHYIIVVSYMSVTPLPEHTVLPKYVQPAVTSADSDSDLIEGPSRISLNCPISFTRINTPVKGHSCKHFQCFDFDNFININFKRPSWRCPHCNQYVCYTDIRLDQNMIEILKNVGKNVVEVIVHADGSWKPVLENDQDVDKIQNKAHNCEKEQTEPQESTCSPNRAPNVLDLTNEDNLDIMDTCETADRKPFHASVPSQFVTPNSTMMGVNSTGVDQIVGGQIDDDSWTGIYTANSRSNTPIVGVTEHPVLLDTVSPAFNQEAEAMQYQFPTTNNLPLVNYRNSLANEYGRSPSATRHINRAPVAVQALPVQSQALGPHSSSSAAILSDTERQQVFSRSSLNLPQASGVSSSTPVLQHQSVTQNRVPPVTMSATTQLQNRYRASRMAEFGNAHLQQALNPQPHRQMQPSNTQWSNIPAGATANSQQAITPPSHQVARQGNFQAGIVRTAGATSNSQQARGMASSQVARQGEHRGPVQAVSRPGELFNSPPDQNWRPGPGRLRGSLSGRPISDDIRQQMIMPTSTQAVQSSTQRPQGVPPVRSPQLDVLIANNRNAYNNSPRP